MCRVLTSVINESSVNYSTFQLASLFYGYKPIATVCCGISSLIRSNNMENAMTMYNTFCGFMDGDALLPPSHFSRAGEFIFRIGVCCSDDEFMLHPCWMEFSVINQPATW